MYHNLCVYLLCLAVFLSSQGGPRKIRNSSHLCRTFHYDLIYMYLIIVSMYFLYVVNFQWYLSIRLLGFIIYHSRNFLSCVDVTIYAGWGLKNVCRPTCSVHIDHEQGDFYRATTRGFGFCELLRIMYPFSCHIWNA